MLGKLMKYDLRSGIRQFGLLWIGLAALATINGFTIRYVLDGDVENELLHFVFGVLPMLLLVALFVVMAVFQYVFIVRRFSKGLLGSEGYLMHTLPVTGAEHIASKTLTSLIFLLANMLAAAVCGGLLMVGLLSGESWAFTDMLSAVEYGFRQISDVLSAGTGWLAAEFAVYLLFAMIVSILQIYTALSIGHLVQKHRGWFSLLAYVGITIAVNIVVRTCTTLLAQSGLYTDAVTLYVEGFGDVLGLAATTLGINIALLLLEGTGFFFATRAILNKHLNLE